MVLQLREDYQNLLRHILPVSVIDDENIVHIDLEPALSDFDGEYCIHHILESCRRVCQAKEHYRWFVDSALRNKCCLPFVAFANADIIIAPTDIHLSKKG